MEGLDGTNPRQIGIQWDEAGGGRAAKIGVIADIARVIAGIGKTKNSPLINIDDTDRGNCQIEGEKQHISHGPQGSP